MKKQLFTLFALSVLFLSACKSDLEPIPSFDIATKLPDEGVIGVSNRSTMSQSAEISWGDNTPNSPIGNSPDTKYHTYSKNGTYSVTLKAINGSKSSSITERVDITNVSGRLGLYREGDFGSVLSPAFFCTISGNGIYQYFYINTRNTSNPSSCAGITDANIWRVQAGTYKVHCENMAKTYVWDFNTQVESGSCKIIKLAD